MKSVSLLLLCFAMNVFHSHCFVAPQIKNSRGFSIDRSSPQLAEQSVNRIALCDNRAVDGTGRGSFILAAVLLLNVWTFSIPPEFRRAYLCPSEPCIENRSLCNNCVTFSEWKSGIEDYYKNGGGIKFDFSIDPKSKAQFNEATGLNL